MLSQLSERLSRDMNSNTSTFLPSLPPSLPPFSKMPSHPSSCSHFHFYREEREPLHEIIQNLFPLLQDMITQILDNNSIEAAHVLRICLKIFWSSTQYSLPPVNGVNVNLWFHALASILNKRLPEASEGIEPIGQPESVEERNEWAWWKVPLSCPCLPLFAPTSTSSHRLLPV
jgi:hypothetical protein